MLVKYAGWSTRAVLSLPAGGCDACLVQVTVSYSGKCSNVERSSPLFSSPMPFYLWLTHVRCCQDGEKSKSLREAQVLEVNVMPSNGVPLAAFHHARDWPGIPRWEGNNIAWMGNTYYILYYQSHGDSMREHGL